MAVEGQNADASSSDIEMPNLADPVLAVQNLAKGTATLWNGAGEAQEAGNRAPFVDTVPYDAEKAPREFRARHIQMIALGFALDLKG